MKKLLHRQGWIVVLFCAALLVPFGANAETSATADDSEVFLLRQLIEIQNELRALRREVSDLRRNIERGVAADTAPQRPRPAPPESVSFAFAEDDPSLGNADAKVAVVEFSDFQCPYCSRFHENTFAKIKQRYIDTNKIRYVMKDFPLPMHAEGPPAALAARCAGAQDAYWDMRDKLFKAHRELGPGRYTELAKELKLDTATFESCMKAGDPDAVVAPGLALGEEAGVSGTPTFLIGVVEDGQFKSSRRLVGAQPISAFSTALDEVLAAAP